MRAICVSITTLALLFGSAVGVAGQMNDELILAVFVTGTVVDGAADETDGRVVYTQEVEWSDPRPPPTLRANATWYVSGESIHDGVMTVGMSILLDGSEGVWRGIGRGIETDDDRYSYYILIGEGAYESLHALLQGTPGIDANGPWGEEDQGWLSEGALPPLPAPPAEQPANEYRSRASCDIHVLPSGS